jgi:endonuclease/exonuclease/phosphatase family metal-dependent hydrolase
MYIIIILSIESIDDFVAANSIRQVTRVILGDFNVVSSSPVCDHLRASGYQSCLEICPPPDTSGTSEVKVTVDNFISHRTHRKEDLGVDHIFVRHDGSSTEFEVFIDETAVIPESLGCSVWNEGFTISDHRPVASTLLFSRKKREASIPPSS